MRNRLSIDPKSVAAAREQLRAMVRGTPIAEAAVAGYNDWQVVEAVERLWKVGAPGSRSRQAPLSSPYREAADLVEPR